MKQTSNLTCLLLAGLTGMSAYGQGTITFDAHSGFNGTSYTEAGMSFRVTIPTPGESVHDYMVIAPGTGIANVPNNPTPYMFLIRQYSPDDYVTFSLTGGSTFGLTSVQLADPSSPSSSVVSIMFTGFKSDGSTISQTFTTPGNNATTLLPYTFNAVFASDLRSVEIDATRWAMDNLVFTVPEPSTLALLGLGAAALASRRLKRR